MYLFVIKKISTRVTGTEFILEGIPGRHFTVNSDDTGLNHYHNSQLSHYLRYCQRLGAEKVIILDETCRINSYRDADKDERKGAEEHPERDPNPRDTLTSYKYRDPRDGGKKITRKTKVKRKKSRRIHKKS